MRITTTGTTVPAGRNFFGRGLALLAAAFAIALTAQPAEAVPAFAVQTGMACQACHVGGFGPQLTPFGREFKMNGYTMRAGTDFTAPVSAMAMASYVHTATDQPPPAPHYAPNDNATIDQLSLFLAGGDGDHFGGFSQFTWDGIARTASWDNLDLRAIDHVTLAGNDVLIGLSVNNSPTIEDEWATLPGWGFPFTDSDLRPAPAAASVISGAMAQAVLGATAYAWWNDSIYTAFGLYASPSTHFLKAMGVDPTGVGEINGVAPYARVAYQKDYGDQNFEVGAFGLWSNLYPGFDKSTGRTDDYSDLGIDAQYQFMGSGENVFTASARYVNEQQSLGATQFMGGSLAKNLTLNEVNLATSYYYQNTYGITASYFDSWGKKDSIFYAGNRTLSPDSAGFMFQADVTPFGGDDAPWDHRLNLRVGLQYTVYTKFNGATSNWDGLGHSASDNNTLRIFIWTAF